jgi:predicted AAA+ superfamily ATPase
MFINRKISKELKTLSREFPIVAVLGPRQSGKTTLTQKLFPDHQFVTLEDPDMREFATLDPRGFLNKYNRNVIIDEIQYCPELFSYLQGIVDQQRSTGSFIITGSENYLMSEKISQSLAGRVGLAILLPFSYTELKAYKKNYTADDLMFTGFYPPVYNRKIRPASFYSTYVNTYLERDVRKISQITDFSRFTRFLKLLAGRTGQLLNKNALSIEAGISHTTVEKWLSVLEAAYIVFRLQPWFVNFNKRIVKQPKIYFYDTGLASYLLGLRNNHEIATHYLRGNLFENFIISELFKENFNRGQNFRFWFWRDNHNNEIDLIIETGKQHLAVEIKSGETFRNDFVKSLSLWSRLSNTPAKDLFIFYGGDKSMLFQDINILEWKNASSILDTLPQN